MKKLIILTCLLILSGCAQTAPLKPKLDVSKLNMELESQIALGEADKIYQQAINNKLDLSKGPCLSNALYGNADYPETMWVLDIAHSPRIAADDLSQNQCSALGEGKAKNFIEMDLTGKVLKIYSPLLK